MDVSAIHPLPSRPGNDLLSGRATYYRRVLMKEFLHELSEVLIVLILVAGVVLTFVSFVLYLLGGFR